MTMLRPLPQLKALRHVFPICLACLVSTVLPSGLEDTSPHCAAWAAMGECTNNAKYMLKSCSLSCYAPVEQQQPLMETNQPSLQNDEAPDRHERQAEVVKSAAISNDAHEFDAVVDLPSSGEGAGGTNATNSYCESSDQGCSRIEEKSLSSNLEELSFDSPAYSPGVVDGMKASDVAQLRELLSHCRVDADNRITAARMDSFDELIANHAKDIADELKMQERKFKDDLAKAERKARKTELLLRHQLREAEDRAASFEEKLRRITTGEEMKEALSRASALAKTLADEEKYHYSLEKQYEEALTETRTKNRECEEREQKTMATAERLDKENSDLRKSQRRLLMRKRRRVLARLNAEHSNSSSALPRSEDHPSKVVQDTEQEHHGIVKACILEALQIFHPSRDLAVSRMFAEICSALLCSRSYALNRMSLVFAFAWIALLRFVWAYLLYCMILRLSKLGRAWDAFSDWFLGLNQPPGKAQHF